MSRDVDVEDVVEVARDVAEGRLSVDAGVAELERRSQPANARSSTLDAAADAALANLARRSR